MQRPDITVLPANHASCADLDAVFGSKGYPATCRCQKFRTTTEEWWYDPIPREERAFRLRQQTDCGNPDSGTTSGLVAYLDGEPVGWCSVAPRSEFIRLGQTPWTGRREDKLDPTVRAGFRGQGITYPLAAATVEHARSRGAAALEAYAMDPVPGQEITWGEIHVGHRNVLAAAGFVEVHRPSKRRVIMRVDS